jgi:hypothetical protein
LFDVWVDLFLLPQLLLLVVGDIGGVSLPPALLLLMEVVILVVLPI